MVQNTQPVEDVLKLKLDYKISSLHDEKLILNSGSPFPMTDDKSLFEEELIEMEKQSNLTTAAKKSKCEQGDSLWKDNVLFLDKGNL